MTVLLLLISLILGVRHAAAPDHLAAVGTFTEKTEATRLHAVWYALRIAAGHSVGMLAVAAVIMSALAVLSPTWVAWTTYGSGIWLCIMAAWILWDLARDLWPRLRRRAPDHQAKRPGGDGWVRLLKRPGAAWAIGLLFGLAVAPGDLAIFTIMFKSHTQPIWAFSYLGVFLVGMFGGLAAVGAGLGWANTRTFLRRTFQGLSGLAGLGVAVALLAGFLH